MLDVCMSKSGKVKSWANRAPPRRVVTPTVALPAILQCLFAKQGASRVEIGNIGFPMTGVRGQRRGLEAYTRSKMV